MTITDTSIELSPNVVRAGEVFLVLDSPVDGHLVFISGTPAGGPPDEPLDSGALDRLKRGDTEGTTISGMEAGGCSEEQDEEDRGMTGPCGNVMKVDVAPGMYAIMAESPEDNAGHPSPAPMAVLTVTP